jgi:hypothetical protein
VAGGATKAIDGQAQPDAAQPTAQNVSADAVAEKMRQLRGE